MFIYVHTVVLSIYLYSRGRPFSPRPGLMAGSSYNTFRFPHFCSALGIRRIVVASPGNLFQIYIWLPSPQLSVLSTPFIGLEAQRNLRNTNYDCQHLTVVSLVNKAADRIIQDNLKYWPGENVNFKRL